ncbi:hypothetical protein [Streptomyces tibetensis]|uniref:hypothetical protein n=1 Tax=Streptomyces tibetensis TaxID=2382123 RepID=UPI003409E04E
MQPLSAPCPAVMIPDATGSNAFSAAYKQAKQQRVVFVAVERHGPRWTVKADAITAPQHFVDDSAYDAIRSAVNQLIRTREIRPDSSAGAAYCVLYDVTGEERARELAAAVHGALYGDLEPLARAVRKAS